MKSSKPLVVRSAKALAELLNLSDAEAQWIELRARLLVAIAREVERRGMTHAALAVDAKTSRSRITAILNGNLKGVSTDLLLRIGASLGLQPDIRFRKAA